MRIRFVSKVLAVLGFLVAAGTAGAQAGSVAGRVTDTESGAPVEGATVQVQLGATVVGSTQSGADGTYRISNVAAGTYAIVATRIGFKSQRVEGVSITAGSTTTTEISMTQLAVQLNPTVVTGTRGAEPEKILDSPNSISMISSERIAERSAATVTDYLKSTPGLSISNGGIAQANIVSRGFNNAFSTTMLMLQDYRFAGVPSLRVNVPFLFTGSSEDIDRIEVLQGPASALYGPNSGAGVLHIITKSPFQSQGTTLTLDGGERSFMRLAGRHAGVFGNGQFGYKLSGEFFRANDWEYNDPNEPASYGADPRIPVSRQNTPVARDFELSKYGMEARLDWRPNDDTEAITTFGYSKIGNAIEITTTFGAAQAVNWSYTNFQQRFRHKDFFAQIFFNGSNSGNDDALDDNGTFYLRSGIPVVDKSTVLVAQVQQGMTFGSTKLTGGLDYIATTPETEGTIMGRNEGDDNITEIGGYLQITQPLTEKLDFMGAVRLDVNDRIDGEQFSPRAAFLYKASPTQNFRLTFNRAFNSPASFSMFLDQYSGTSQNLGPLLGTREVRIFGNPAKEGWQYDRSGVSTVSDGLMMRTSGNAVIPASSALTLNSLMNGGISSLLVGGIAGTFGLTPTQQANIVAALNAVNPAHSGAAGTFVGTAIRRVDLPGSPVVPISSITDLDPLGANFSNTWELGYKGIFGNNLRISADYWYQIRPADPTTGLIPQVAFYEPASLGAYLGAAGTGVTNALATNGVPVAAIPAVLTGWTTTLAGIPTGALNFDNPIYDQTYLMFTYQNGTGHVDVRGIDLAVDYLFNYMWSVEATYSKLSRNLFPDAPGSSVASPLAANTPKHRGSLTIRRVDELRGLSAELRGRYMDAFDVNSGVLNSFNIGTPTPYPSVPVNAFIDVGFSWRLPVAQNVRWSLNIQNLLGNEVQSFAGVAPIGRLATTRVQYSF